MIQDEIEGKHLYTNTETLLSSLMLLACIAMNPLIWVHLLARSVGVQLT